MPRLIGFVQAARYWGGHSPSNIPAPDSAVRVGTSHYFLVVAPEPTSCHEWGSNLANGNSRQAIFSLSLV